MLKPSKAHDPEGKDMTVEELATRVDSLERENLRLRRIGAVVLVLAVGVAIVGAATPAQLQDIDARRIRIIDESDEVRAEMAADGILYFDENGTARALITGAGIAYFDENGRRRAWMTAPGIDYFDESGKRRAGMDANGISYADENGIDRAELGRVEVVTQSNAETTYPAQVVLYDADGKVIWSAIR